MIKGLYAITDPNLIEDKELISAVSQAIDGGISVLQYRNKLASPQVQLQQAKQLQKLCHQHKVTFIINDNVELAEAVSADGVHIGKADKTLAYARKKLGAKAIIGISCYNDINRAIVAEQNSASYIAFGRFFPSKTKPEAKPADLTLIKQAKKSLQLPIVAIGGIDINNIDQLIEQDVDATAVINGIFAQPNITKACHLLSDKFIR